MNGDDFGIIKFLFRKKRPCSLGVMQAESFVELKRHTKYNILWG